MAEAAFRVKYDGPALVTGQMPVRDLAPALLALGDLFADASALLYPRSAPPALNIKATKEGSFFVDLILGSGWDQLVDIFTSDPATAILNLKDYILAGGGLFWLVKRARKRKVEKQESGTEPGHTKITFDDGTTVEVPSEVWALYGNIEVRKKARRVVEPVARPGVDRLEFREGDDVTMSVEKDDVPAYDVDDADVEELSDAVVETVVSIAAITFVEGNKWRLSDGEQTFFATIEDAAFLSRVQRGVEVFRAGDMLRCCMRIVQTRGLDGLHTEYQVREVLEHIPRPTQMELGGDEP